MKRSRSIDREIDSDATRFHFLLKLGGHTFSQNARIHGLHIPRFASCFHARKIEKRFHEPVQPFRVASERGVKRLSPLLLRARWKSVVLFQKFSHMPQRCQGRAEFMRHRRDEIRLQARYCKLPRHHTPQKITASSE